MVKSSQIFIARKMETPECSINIVCLCLYQGSEKNEKIVYLIDTESIKISAMIWHVENRKKFPSQQILVTRTSRGRPPPTPPKDPI